MNARVHQVARALLAGLPAPATRVVPGYWNVMAEFRPEYRDGPREALAAARQADEGKATAGRLHRVPVVYDGEDLDDVAALTGLSLGDVVRRHAVASYRVYTVGFTPGFAYLGGLDPALAVPRLDRPRPVRAGSVALAGAQTGIYPSESPGGWRVIGRTSLPLFDRAEAAPLLRPGDEVSFRPVDMLPAPAPQPEVPAPEGEPLFEVLQAGVLDTLQDSGRWGAAHLGLAGAGALDRRALRHANALLGNGPWATALEVTARGPVLRALRDLTAALTGDGPSPPDGSRNASLRLRRDEVLDLTLPGPGARSYLAVPDGFSGWVVNWSAATDLRAGIGGYEGRALRDGDRLVGGVPSWRRPLPRRLGLAAPPAGERLLRVHPGPQAGLFPGGAWRALLSRPFTVVAGDRMGLRLAGPRLEAERHEVVSEGVPLGSIQVPPDGQAILLLNDHGTLGGYAKIAVVATRDLPVAGQLREGHTVRFRPA